MNIETRISKNNKIGELHDREFKFFERSKRVEPNQNHKSDASLLEILHEYRQ